MHNATPAFDDAESCCFRCFDFIDLMPSLPLLPPLPYGRRCGFCCYYIYADAAFHAADDMLLRRLYVTITPCFRHAAMARYAAFAAAAYDAALFIAHDMLPLTLLRAIRQRPCRAALMLMPTTPPDCRHLMPPRHAAAAATARSDAALLPCHVDASPLYLLPYAVTRYANICYAMLLMLAADAATRRCRYDARRPSKFCSCYLQGEARYADMPLRRKMRCC